MSQVIFLGWDRPEGKMFQYHDRGASIVPDERKRFVLEIPDGELITRQHVSSKIIRKEGDYYHIQRTRMSVDGRDIGYFDVSVPYGDSYMNAVIEEINLTEGIVILEKVPSA